MIIDRYLFKEIIVSLISVTTVLLLIFSSKHFVRYMSDAVAGELPTSMILQLLSLFTLSYLVLIVPFAMYLSVIITLGRLYKDNEITAAEACGLGLPRIIQSVFYLSVLLAVFVGLLALWVVPWAESEQYNIRDLAKTESEFEFIAPGRFHEIRGGKGVFYIEDISPEVGRMKKVFVYIKEEGKIDIFSSLTGYLEVDSKMGSQFIVLENGYRFEALEPDGGYRLHDYDKSGVRIAQHAASSGKLKMIERPTISLWNDKTAEAQAELHWRIAMPISCVLLTLMAVLLSKTNPRQGRFGKLFVALIAYIAYIYVLMLTKTALKNGDVPLMLGMWWVHALAIIFIMILLANQFGWRWVVSQIFSSEKTNNRKVIN